MKKVTTLWLCCLVVVGFANPTWAQEREDVLWARFTDEEITLDGELNEAVWQDAEMVQLNWGENAGIPGSGWGVENLPAGLEEPTDPPSGTVYVLAKGDSLYFAFVIEDASIGGGTTVDGFNWNWDAIFLPFSNPAGFGPTDNGRHHFPASSETFFTWWSNADTTDTGEPEPGAPPRFHSHNALFGVNPNVSATEPRTEEQITNWDAGWTINGTTNDDTHGDDDGYVVEMRLNMAAAGYDLNAPEGDVVQFGLAINDTDFRWPGNSETAATSRVFMQNAFGNFSSGAVKVHTHPSVTTDSGAPPSVPADVVIPEAEGFDAPTVDGSLDEEVWDATPLGITIQGKNEELMASWPAETSWNSGYFQSGGDQAPPVLEPSPAEVKWFYKDNWVYFGINVDDQAVDTTRDEAGDGLTLTINRRDTLASWQYLLPQEYTVTIGPDGEARTDRRFSDLPEGSYMVAGSLKGASTGADPSDVDEGYQLEIGFNLVDALGYPEDLGDHALFFSLHTFDLDRFEDEAQNYSIRTWWNRERTGGVPVWGYMDAATNVAAEDLAEVPESVELHGNYPNPFNPTTTIRYSLPTNGEVSILVFDLLGRQVAQLQPGLQSAGRQDVRLDAAGLASGAYFYRVEVTPAAGEVHVSEVGRMILVK